MTTGVLLVGHGSLRNPDSSRPVYQQARQLRQRLVDTEIRVAFWKEEPAICRGLDGCTAEWVVVAPLFMAEGYFTRRVIPRELRLTGPHTWLGNQRVTYVRPVGVHPAMSDVVLDRAIEAGASRSTCVIVLGHGTPRDPRSGETVQWHAQRISQRGRFGQVCAAFIDMQPRIEDVVAAVGSRETIVVPFFMAAGWHVAQTIPRDLSESRVDTVNAGALHFAQPVGTHPRVAEIVEALCRGSGAWTAAPPPTEPPSARLGDRSFFG